MFGRDKFCQDPLIMRCLYPKSYSHKVCLSINGEPLYMMNPFSVSRGTAHNESPKPDASKNRQEIPEIHGHHRNHPATY